MLGPSGAPLEKRSVAACFIIREPEELSEQAAAAMGPAEAAAHNRPMVALFRRSSRVKDYKRHWAPIAGRIYEDDDTTPLAVAWRALAEGAALTPSMVTLIRHGKSIVFGDAIVGCEWTVYPFAFRLHAPASAIHIGDAGEYEEWAWVDPLAVLVNTGDLFVSGGGGGGGVGVPNLAPSLRRAWFEADLGSAPGTAGEALARGLDTLQSDHRSGARQLAGTALGVLRDVMLALDADKHLNLAVSLDRHIWWTQVRFAAWHIWRNGRESMGAAVLSILLAALGGIEKTLEAYARADEIAGGGRGAAPPPATKRVYYSSSDHMVPEIERRIAERARPASAAPVAAAFLQYVSTHFPRGEDGNGNGTKQQQQRPLTILTVSESSTVAFALQQLITQGRSLYAALDLRVLESRPLFEGVSLAASLVAHARGRGDDATLGGGETPKITVSVYTDAGVALAAAGADMVLLGADRVASAGAISNKTGSLPAVLCAKNARQYFGKEMTTTPTPVVVVLTETDKIAPPDDPRDPIVVEEENDDTTQMLRAWEDAADRDHVPPAAARLRAELAAGTAAPVAVQVCNVAFEWVPPALVDVYVTEQGLWAVDAIRQHSEALGQEAERMFRGV